VIEGTNSQKGVPGSYSADELLRASGGVTFTATGATGKTVIQDTTASYSAGRWVSSNGPGFWLVCTSASDSSNVDAARKISAWTQSTTSFTTAAFPANLSTGDEFEVRQGFKQAPNHVDIESAQSGFDRYFQLSALPGADIGYYGSGVRNYRTEIELRLRLLRYSRDVDIRRSVLENLRALVDAATLRSNYESTYTRWADAQAEYEIVENDADKIVALARWPLQYRVQLGYE
jgi:hypothetical protein